MKHTSRRTFFGLGLLASILVLPRPQSVPHAAVLTLR